MLLLCTTLIIPQFFCLFSLSFGIHQSQYLDGCHAVGIKSLPTFFTCISFFISIYKQNKVIFTKLMTSLIIKVITKHNNIRDCSISDYSIIKDKFSHPKNSLFTQMLRRKLKKEHVSMHMSTL